MHALMQLSGSRNNVTKSFATDHVPNKFELIHTNNNYVYPSFSETVFIKCRRDVTKRQDMGRFVFERKEIVCLLAPQISSCSHCSVTGQ